jgi:putative ABC transport system permease protein
MRIRSVKGKPVRYSPADTLLLDQDDSTRADSTSIRGWAVRREYRSTWRDTLVGSEKLLEGAWWKGPGGGEGAADVSLELDIARELSVTIGDTIVWDVQGALVPSVVRSIREVDWARFEPNFFAVFRSGPLNTAPQTLVTLTRVTDAAQRGSLQRAVTERFPNVSSIDIASIQAAFERILARVALAIRFMAVFSLATGTIVLIGAIATTRFQRIREGVLLRTLGATRNQVLRVVFAEYLTLGALSSVMAVILASIATWAITKWVFKSSFALPVPALTGLLASVVALTLVVGFWNSLEVVNRTPLEVLRND